ncbi:MAG TPA: hypothetical protein VJ044_16515, partial [Candidatus Hodarchaeales archaeon]|nr:hypothetical protein [Candidatus Hodarchaeales archaeon]
REPTLLYVFEDFLLNFSPMLLPINSDSYFGIPLAVHDFFPVLPLLPEWNFLFPDIGQEGPPLDLAPFSSGLVIENDYFPAGRIKSVDADRRSEFIDSTVSNYSGRTARAITERAFSLISSNLAISHRLRSFDPVKLLLRYSEDYLFPRLAQQLAIWLDQASECSSCESPFPFPIFLSCPLCGGKIILKYSFELIADQFRKIKDLALTLPSPSIEEQLQLIEEQFRDLLEEKGEKGAKAISSRNP